MLHMHTRRSKSVHKMFTERNNKVGVGTAEDQANKLSVSQGIMTVTNSMASVLVPPAVSSSVKSSQKGYIWYNGRLVNIITQIIAPEMSQK